MNNTEDNQCSEEHVATLILEHRDEMTPSLFESSQSLPADWENNKLQIEACCNVPWNQTKIDFCNGAITDIPWYPSGEPRIHFSGYSQLVLESGKCISNYILFHGDISLNDYVKIDCDYQFSEDPTFHVFSDSECKIPKNQKIKSKDNVNFCCKWPPEKQENSSIIISSNKTNWLYKFDKNSEEYGCIPVDFLENHESGDSRAMIN